MPRAFSSFRHLRHGLYDSTIVYGLQPFFYRNIPKLWWHILCKHWSSYYSGTWKQRYWPYYEVFIRIKLDNFNVHAVIDLNKPTCIIKMASHYITSIFISELKLNLFKQWKDFIHQIVTKLFNHRLIKLKLWRYWIFNRIPVFCILCIFF